MATQVGEAVIKLTFDGQSVKASLNRVESQVEKSGSATGSKWGQTWATAAGNLIARGVSKVASMVTNTMGGAIKRLDQLNNFPKVMQSLGYSAEEADVSVSKISDALDGLPTTLDAMTADVQKLAATMGNLAEGEVNATSVGLGLNDMLLAGGKGTEIASAAMEQYNQMLANGRVDMQSWRSMVNAAPGQMNQLAQSILGATANQADLYKALQEGTVSFDDFNAAIVRLDQEGGEGFASFYDQATLATGGIATQLENISTTMNKIVAAALEGNLDDISKYINQLSKRIGAVAPTLIQGFTGAFVSLAEALPDIMLELLPALMDGLNTLAMGLFNAAPMFVNAIVNAIPIIMQGLMRLLDAMVQAIPTVMPQIIQALTTGIITIAQTISQPQFLQLILAAALTLFMELVKALPDVIVALVDALPSIIDNIIAFLTDPGTIAMLMDAAVKLFGALVAAVPKILGSLLDAFGKLVGSLWEGIKRMFGEFASNFGNFIGGIFKNAINGVLTFIENFINGPIDAINGFLGVINDNFDWLGVHISPISRVSLPRLAEGGTVSSATLAMIGEDGQEAVLPLEKNTSWAGVLAETLAVEMEERGESGRPINVYMTNQINNRLDADEIGRIMEQSIRRAA